MKKGAWSGVLTLATVAMLLSVPVTGGATRLWALRGDTPATASDPDSGGPGPSTDATTYLGTVDIAASPTARTGIWARVPVGGISGIDCLPTGCLAVSDDPGRRGPVRAYPLDPVSGLVGRPLVLTDTRGDPYRPGAVDPEGIRFTRHGIVWTAEGTATVTVADRDGHARETLPAGEGIRVNQGLEAVAVDRSDGGERIITATEAPPDGRGSCRVTAYTDGEVTASYDYPGTGVSDLLAVGDGSFLFLERGYTVGVGNSVAVYRSVLPDRDGGTLRRDLVLDMAEVLGAGQVGNAEALAWGADTPDGRRTLLVATDDNFSPRQRSVIHTVALPVGWPGA